MTNLFLDETERNRLLVEWNDTAYDCPRDRTVVALFDERVRADPDAVAVIAEDATLSYGQLDAEARRVATALAGLGAGPERRVVIYLDRTSRIPVATLGVLKAGAAYVPLDADRAGNRLATALDDGDVCAVLTERALRERIPTAGVPVLCVDDDLPVGDVPVGDTNTVVAPPVGAAACVVYTSGSTGRPKGVVISHANLAGLYYAWERAYQLADLRVQGQLTSFSFVVFQADLVRALCSGATLVLFATDTVLDPRRLYDEMVRTGVRFVEFVPALLRAVLRHCAETGQSLDFLDLLVVGSDRWLYGEHERMRSTIGNRTRIVHSFGLTETTVDSAYFTGTELTVSAGKLTPIGRPFPNVRTYVLDEDMQPAPTGMTGELYIGGIGVARGYHADPGLTAQRFVPDPFGPPGSRLYRTGDLARHLGDGNIQFLGRQDGMVKVRGFRVELGEVEMVLRAHPGVHDAVVVAHQPSTSDDQVEVALAAYVVPTRPALRDEARQLVDIPNGMSVASVNPAETHQFYQELFLDRMYLRNGVDLRDGDVVFDVGANIGMFALCAHDTAKVSVYAFEPSPEVADVLAVNMALHGVRAKVFRFGLSDRARRAALTYYPASTGMSSLYGDAADERSVLGTIIGNQFRNHGAEPDIGEWLDERLRDEVRDCELRTLGQVLAEQAVERVDLLKVVVQKSEWDVLAGLREQDWPRIGQLVIETYDIDHRVDTIRDALTRRGYQVVVDQAPLFQGANVYLIYAVRPDWRSRDDLPRATASAPDDDALTAPLSVRGLYEYLRGRLADYMVPTRLALVDQLPLTATGKIDRAALSADSLVNMAVGAEFVAPRTDVESRIAAIWADILQVERVGVHDDFFQLGGHSLLATQVVSRLLAEWGIEVPLRDFLRIRTVEQFALEVERLRDQTPAATGDAGIPRLDRAAYRAARVAPSPRSEARNEEE